MLQSGWISAAGNTTHREHPWDATPGVNGVITFETIGWCQVKEKVNCGLPLNKSINHRESHGNVGWNDCRMQICYLQALYCVLVFNQAKFMIDCHLGHRSLGLGQLHFEENPNHWAIGRAGYQVLEMEILRCLLISLANMSRTPLTMCNHQCTLSVECLEEFKLRSLSSSSVQESLASNLISETGSHCLFVEWDRKHGEKRYVLTVHRMSTKIRHH